jgi:NAD(P)-dependent dehydrogenase (short-subunit alcohol dehydrogenase family)
MHRQYESKVVVITGGGGGIGKAAARRFLEEGARVVLGGTRQAKLEAAQAELDPTGERVAIHAGRITRREEAQRLVDVAIERFGGVDVLVNSTGIFRPVPFLEQTEEQFEEALGSILRPSSGSRRRSFRRCASAAAARSSTSARCGRSTRSRRRRRAPTRRRRGRHMLTKNLALELAADGIRVNTVALAFVETPAYERFMSPTEAREVLDAVNDFHPLRRHGVPGDVTEAILFLAGSGAGWITGTTLPVDGGVLAGRSPAVHAEVEAAA